MGQMEGVRDWVWFACTWKLDESIRIQSMQHLKAVESGKKFISMRDAKGVLHYIIQEE